MKVSKILGCVLSLHICVIAVLLVQPGCQTAQPPSQTHTQDRAVRPDAEEASRTPRDLIPATQMGEGGDLDAAFNTGFEDEPIDSFEPIESAEPDEPMSAEQTVDIEDSGYQTYTVKKGDNLWSIAKRYDISVNELYAANDLNKNSILRVGQQIEIPVEGGSATVSQETPDSYQPSGYDQETTTYTVRRGDNLSKIAQRYDTTVNALKAANDKSSDMIRVGETLTVPAGGSAAEDDSSSARSDTESTRSGAASDGATQTHTVESGEYPAKIARQYGMTANELLELNGISDPRKLRVGQELKVSGSGSADNVDSRTETVAEQPAEQPTDQPVSVTPTQPSAGTGPSGIRVIEADPLVEGELDEPEAAPEPESDSDDVFDDAVEIPVIRLEE